MKYDRQTAWNVKQKIELDKTFAQGYRAGYQGQSLSNVRTQRGDKREYVKGFREGIRIAKKDKLKELVTGKPTYRFGAEGPYLDTQAFISRKTNKDAPYDNRAYLDTYQQEIGKWIADAIDEEIVNNDK